jgi:hypothetical protein
MVRIRKTAIKKDFGCWEEIVEDLCSVLRFPDGRASICAEYQKEVALAIMDSISPG